MGGSSSSQRRRQVSGVRPSGQPQVNTAVTNGNARTLYSRVGSSNNGGGGDGANGSGAAGANGNQPYYLMFGGPPVHYRYNPGGPMIFYVDRQQPAAPPPEVGEGVKLKNLANVLKHTLHFEPDEAEPHLLRPAFRCDTTVPTTVQLYYARCEKLESKGGDQCNVNFVSEAGTPETILPAQEIPAETDYAFVAQTQDAFDVRKHAAYLRYDQLKPTFFPLVIHLSYEADKPQIEEEGAEDEGKSTVKTRQSQFTYCEVYKSTDDDMYRLKFIKQRLQLGDGTLFDLEDIYGIGEEAGHAGGGEPSSGEVLNDAPAADAVSVDGDECVICLANERDTTVMPCRHMCLCGECAQVLRKQTNKCPICRTVIERLMTLKKN